MDEAKEVTFLRGYQGNADAAGLGTALLIWPSFLTAPQSERQDSREAAEETLLWRGTAECVGALGRSHPTPLGQFRVFVLHVGLLCSVHMKQEFQSPVPFNLAARVDPCWPLVECTNPPHGLTLVVSCLSFYLT